MTAAARSPGERSDRGPGSAPPASGRRLAALFVLALAVRLVALVALDTPGDAAGRTPWEWGGEAPTLAASLAAGEGLADPWKRPHGAWAEGTGPSSWLTPVYPGLVAVALRLGSGVGPQAAWLLFALQAVASALTAVLLVRLGERLGLPRAGLLGGLLLALDPIAIWNAVGVVWDTTLVALGVTGFLLVLVRGGRGPAALARAGLVFGALLLLNPAPAAMLPAVLGWIALAPAGAPGAPRGASAVLGRWVLFAAAALLVCLPWMVRNARVLGTWQLRPNFGVELRIGNQDGAHGRPQPFLHHPSHVEEERALYVRLGEAAYGAENAERALAWIRAHPAGFLALTLRRAGLFWWGELPTADPRSSAGRGPAADPRSWIKFLVYCLVGAGGLLGAAWAPLGRDGRFLVLGALVLFGLPYYLTHVSERYRFPLDPLLLMLAGWVALRLTRGRAAGLDRPPPGMD